MKAHVKVVELDGTADEIAKVIGGVTAPTIIDHPAPSTPFDEPATQPVIEHQAKPAKTHVMDALESAAYDAAGEPALTEPVEEWREIPVEYRWWNDAMTTCHIRTRPGIDVAWCKKAPSKIGHRRMPGENPPAETIASVCATCNQRITEAARA